MNVWKELKKSPLWHKPPLYKQVYLWLVILGEHQGYRIQDRRPELGCCQCRAGASFIQFGWPRREQLVVGTEPEESAKQEDIAGHPVLARKRGVDFGSK